MRLVSCLILLLVPWLICGETNRIDRPDFFKTLVNPESSHCADETTRRAADFRAGDRALAWIRGPYDGGAIPLRFFLVPFRVVNDAHGVFVFDADAGFVRGFESSAGFVFHGWRNGVMVLRDREGNLYSALTGTAFEGPKAGTRLKPLPTIETDWAHWTRAYPGTVTYRISEEYVPYELPQSENADSVASRPDPDSRLGQDQIVIGVELNDAAKAYPISALSTNHVIHDTLGDRPVVVLWHASTRTAAAYSPHLRGEAAPESIHLEPAPKGATAPFKDKKTSSLWTVEGRAVEGPLKGSALEWIPSVQCKWFAWAAEYPRTEVYAASHALPDAPKTPIPAGPIESPRANWDKLAKGYVRLIRLNPVTRELTVVAESDGKERTISWSIETEFYNRGSWGKPEEFSPDQRLYVMAVTGPDNEWLSAYAVADEMSMQAMSRPYVLKHYDKENGKIVLVDERGGHAPLDLLFDSRSLFVTATPEPLPVGQASYCNTRLSPTGRVVMELLDATSFASEQQRRWQQHLETAATNGLAGRVLDSGTETATNRVTLLVRRADAWIARSLLPADKARLQVSGRADSVKRVTVLNVRPDHAQARITLELPDGSGRSYLPGTEVRLHTKVPKELDPVRPPDLGRFTVRQERIAYFLSTVYCTCGLDPACAGHWNTLAACKGHGCVLPDSMSQRVGASIDAGLTDQQILEALLKREGEQLLKQRH